MDHLNALLAPRRFLRCGRLVVGSDTLPRLPSYGHSLLLQLWCCLHPSIQATALILVLILSGHPKDLLYLVTASTRWRALKSELTTVDPCRYEMLVT